MMRIKEISALLMTLLIALIGGWLMHLLGVPAPYLLGSIFATWLAGAILQNFFSKLPELAIPRWFQVIVLVGLSTLIGAAFNPEMSGKLIKWSSSVIILLITSVIATWLAFSYLHKIKKYDKALALLCTLPGGQAEVIAMSRDLVEKDYVVAFSHLVRVAFIACLIPFLLWVTVGDVGVETSYAVAAQMKHIGDVSWQVLLQFIALALLGVAIAKLFRIPIPHLLGPVLVSSVAHLMGWVELPRTQEFIILAQITIGGGVGARLSKVRFSELIHYLGDAIVTTLILVGTYCSVGYVVGTFIGVQAMQMILAFIPGGIFEVTVLALIFGYEIAFVAFHHTIRLLFVYFALPLLAAKVRK